MHFMRLDRVPTFWTEWPGLTRYSDAVEKMHIEWAQIKFNQGREQVWLIESPAGYSLGAQSSGNEHHILDTSKVSIEKVDGPPRGGFVSYHGPGVRMILLMLDLNARRKDSAGFVRTIETWIINALAEIGIAGYHSPDDPAGVWVDGKKIAAIGTRLSGWVSTFGATVYVHPDLSHFDGIVPCGIPSTVTSIAALGNPTTMEEFNPILQKHFHLLFGPTSLIKI